MTKNRLLSLLLCIILFPATMSFAVGDNDVITEIEVDENVLIVEKPSAGGFSMKKNSKRPLRFAWGAELAGGIEMSGHDMSTIGLNASFGMEWSWIRFLGVVAEADIMVDNSSRTIPVALNFRTDFSKRRKLLFLDLRGGVALNYFQDEQQTRDAYLSGGLGVTLATGRRFASHIIVAYTFVGRETCFSGNIRRPCPGMSYVSMRLGVDF